MGSIRIALAAAALALTALTASAQPYARGMISANTGYAGLRTAQLQFGLSYGYGSDYYAGNYYRPLSDRGYYYLGYYYPEIATVTRRTPLSAPPPGIVPTPNLAGTSTSSPDYTFPELINPSTNPTIRPKP